MMQPSDPGIAILADLAALGMAVRVDGDTLWIRPGAKLTPELAARIGRHKAEVIEALRQSSRPSAPAAARPRSERWERFAIAQTALRRRGFHVLADKPEVVLALVEAAEEIAAKLAEGAGDE